MGRLVKDSNLGTREARRKLTARKAPYWRLIVEGIHLGYYKGGSSGKWYVKARTPEGKYIWQAIGAADDFVDANGHTVLNYSQAQDKVKQLGEKVRCGTDYDDNKPYTVNNAIEDYLADFKANGKKSYYSTLTQINAHIVPAFDNKIIDSITFKQLTAWKNKLATSSKRLRSSKLLTSEQNYHAYQDSDPEYQRKRRATANRIITIFKAILNHAFNTNRVKTNECWSRLKPFKNVSEPKIRFLTETESVRLINACATDFRLLVRGALLSGARYGELTSLNVSDFNVDNSTLFIHLSKSGKPRHVPLNAEGVIFFQQLTVGRNANEPIFMRHDGKRWGKNYQVRPLDAACQIAKISPSINFHILRHTYGSALAMKGVPLQVIAAVLGHSDTRITHKHYAHLMPSYIADVIREHLPSFGKSENHNIVSFQNKTGTA